MGPQKWMEHAPQNKVAGTDFETCLPCLQDCPQGYKLTPGDIPDWGNSIKPGGYLNQNIGQCKDLCNANNLCCSFEWSPTERRCNLNQECVPTEGKYKDYLFCHKQMRRHGRVYRSSMLEGVEMRT